MTKDRIHLSVATARVAGWQTHERAPKSAQRQAALLCREKLRCNVPGLNDDDMSVSHSRGWAAVGADRNAALSAIGVDVEYIEPNRDWPRIIRYLSPAVPQPVTAAHGALIWTFYEAVFKATGVWPTPTEIAVFAAACRVMPTGGLSAEHLCGHVHVLSSQLPQDRRFAFSIAVGCKSRLAGAVLIEWLDVSSVEPV